jgi:hypothetical protein
MEALMALTLLKDIVSWEDGKLGVDIPAGTVSYSGAVLRIKSKNERIMSDVWDTVSYAEVWNGKGVTDISLGCSEFGWAYAVDIDATPDVVAQANDWLLALKVAEFEADRLTAISRARSAAEKVAPGKEIVIVKGRKVPIGAEGRVFWVGPDKFSRYGGLRIGFKNADGATFWTAASNAKVKNPELYFSEASYPARDYTDAAKRALDESTKNRYGTEWYSVPVAKAA